MKFLFFSFCLLAGFAVYGQPREEYLDFRFKTTKFSPFYYALTEKKDSVWQQKVYYISTSRMARECSFLDENCKVLHGKYTLFDSEGYLKESGGFSNGKREGIWLGYDDKGFVTDSGMYVNGHLKGIRMKWYSNGMPSDSLNFDGAGNGVQVSWYDDGTPASAGYWIQDTVKKGTWQYFFHNVNSGSPVLKAVEKYVDGKLTVCNCFTEKGEAVDTALCREKSAVPSGGTTEWVRFLQRSLTKIVMNLAARGVKAGNYTVVVKFVVLEDGMVSEFTPLTRLGQGIEEEVIKIMRSAPKWEPGRQFGRPVKSYHTQPITFVIQG